MLGLLLVIWVKETVSFVERYVPNQTWQVIRRAPKMEIGGFCIIRK